MPTQFGKHFWPDFSYVSGLRLDYLSPTIYFTDLLILVVIILSFKKTITFILSLNVNIKLLILTIFALLSLGIVFSKTPYAGYYGLIKITELFFLSIYIINNFQGLSKKTLFVCFSIPIIYESLLSMLQVLNNGAIGGVMYFLGERAFNPSTPGIANASIGGELILRPYATFSHPNVLAGFLIIYMFFLLHLFKKQEEKILLILLTIATISLFLTLSRTAILYWLLSLMFLFGTSIYKKYKKAKLNINKTLFVLTTAVFIIFLSIQGTTLVQRFLETSPNDLSFTQRQGLVINSLDMFSTNPILGVGLNNFYHNLTNNAFIQPVHNIFLLVLSQGGIILLLIFAYVLTKALITVLKGKNVYLLFSLLAIIVLGSFDHYFLTLQQGQIITVLVLGVIFSNKTQKSLTTH